MNKTAKIISACAVCAAAAGLCVYVLSLNKDTGNPTFSNIREVEVATASPYTIPENWAETYNYVPSSTGMSERAELFLEKNRDIIGWINIDNTPIDYPFVIDPGEITAGQDYGDEDMPANSYYLHNDLYGEYTREGTLFMDYRDIFGSSEVTQSENIVIHGHNMANNTMFGALRKYRQDFEFYDKSPIIELSSNYKDYQYIIFGFLITSGNWYTDFCYWEMEELNTKEEFDSYVENVKKGAMVDTGVDVQYGDKLLTLSTCYADDDNSRFIVVARRLRKNELADDMSTIDRTEEYLEKKKQEEASAAEEDSSQMQDENAADAE